jgi:hypothetical protein
MCPPYLWYPNNTAKVENPKDSTTQMPKPVAGTDQASCLCPWMLLINYYKGTITGSLTCNTAGGHDPNDCSDSMKLYRN